MQSNAEVLCVSEAPSSSAEAQPSRGPCHSLRPGFGSVRYHHLPVWALLVWSGNLKHEEHVVEAPRTRGELRLLFLLI